MLDGDGIRFHDVDARSELDSVVPSSVEYFCQKTF
jgi:hypothetical protein